MRELFGSESEDDDGPLPASTAPQAGPDDEGPGPAPAPVEQDQMRDLFGSDDEDEAASQGGDATAWDDADDGLGWVWQSVGCFLSEYVLVMVGCGWGIQGALAPCRPAGEWT